MTINRLVVAFYEKNCAKILNRFLLNREIKWLYLGKNFFKMQRLENNLGDKFRRVDIAKLHDQVAKDLRHEHVLWVDDLNRRNGSLLHWWFWPISSRNIYESDLFQYCCYIEILERLWSDKNNLPQLIVIESSGFARMIRKWGIKKSINVRCINSTQRYYISFKIIMFFVMRWGKFAAALMFRVLAAYVTKFKHGSKRDLQYPAVIVHTFLHDYCLLEDGAFQDRYFPYLHEYLLKNNTRVLVHPMLHGFLFDFFSIYKRMRNNHSQFILQEDFLHVSDYVKALTFPLRVLFKKIDAVPFRGVDFSDVLKEERKNIPSGLQAVLTYCLFLRLGEAGFKPQLIISWYENQVVDKALIAASRLVFPETKIIGAQLFIHPPNYLSLFPSRSEVEARLTPHLLLETSKKQCAVVQSFSKSIVCRPAAALRFSHVFNEECMLKAGEIDQQQTLKILLLLSFYLDEAVELLEMIKLCLPELTDDVKIVVKGHPDYDSKKLMKAYGEQNWPKRFKIFEGNMCQALDDASMVISSNSSSMVEAVAKGIPVIFVGRQTVLNQNTLSKVSMEITTECFSRSELLEAIKKYIELSEADKNMFKKMGLMIRDLYFEPVKEETMRPFLGFTEN